MAARLLTVALSVTLLAGCQMTDSAGTTASFDASQPGAGSEIWLGPDGCMYRFDTINGERVGMTRLSQGDKGPCFK
ncbi:MAG: hypothetical protein AAFO58_02140 [Pseudomonadota bacterium]